jgi:hypothetical protein
LGDGINGIKRQERGEVSHRGPKRAEEKGRAEVRKRLKQKGEPFSGFPPSSIPQISLIP